MMKKFLLSLIGLIFSMPSHALDLRVAVWDGAAPFMTKTEQGWRGICVDIYKAIETLDPQLRFVIDEETMPLRRIEYELHAGRRDLICGARKTPAREAAGMQFLKSGFYTSGYRLAVRSDDDVQVSSWEDVKKLGNQGVVLIMQGHGEIERLQQLGIQLDSGTPSAEQNLIKLEAGRARFFYHRDIFFKSSSFNPKDHPKVRLIPTVFDPSPAYIAAGKMLSKDTLAQIETAFNRLMRSGEIARIVKQNGME